MKQIKIGLTFPIAALGTGYLIFVLGFALIYFAPSFSFKPFVVAFTFIYWAILQFSVSYIQINPEKTHYRICHKLLFLIPLGNWVNKEEIEYHFYRKANVSSSVLGGATAITSFQPTNIATRSTILEIKRVNSKKYYPIIEGNRSKIERISNEIFIPLDIPRHKEFRKPKYRRR